MRSQGSFQLLLIHTLQRSLKSMLLSRFLNAFTSTSICNPIVKTHMFLQLFSFRFFFFLFVALSCPASKKASKTVSETPQNLSKRLFEFSCVLEVLPWQVWANFGPPNGLLKPGLEASPRPSETFSFHLGLIGGLQNRFWRLLGPLGPGF